MKRKNRTNALVIELMTAVLFFMLSSVILVRVLSHAHALSTRAQLLSQALAEAQNTADRVYATDDFMETMKADGFSEGEPGVWEKDLDDMRISVIVQPHRLRWCEVVVQQGREILVRLPCIRYLGSADSKPGLPDDRTDAGREEEVQP